MSIFFWTLAVLGHVAICSAVFNFVHARSVPATYRIIGRKFTEKLVLAFLLLPFAASAVLLILKISPEQFPSPVQYLAIAYAWIAVAMALYCLLRWLYRAGTRSLPTAVQRVDAVDVDVEHELGEPICTGFKGRLFRAIPFNQVTRLRIEKWDWRLPGLPSGLNGTTICHLSDLHFTGLVKREFFDAVVERANELNPDLIFVTGDIVDDDRCVGWIGDVLGKLRCKRGSYYVLGNHDRLVSNQPLLRQALADAGLIAAADGSWHSLAFGNAELLIAGNELPWYRGSLDLPLRNDRAGNQMSVLLSHSPDQIGWAVHRQFDLMFAGHTHGGQIRLPIAGAVIAPSRYGIKYAGGTFRTRGTLMHVSRGISSDEPIRINCPPELSLFTLRLG